MADVTLTNNQFFLSPWRQSITGSTAKSKEDPQQLRLPDGKPAQIGNDKGKYDIYVSAAEQAKFDEMLKEGPVSAHARIAPWEGGFSKVANALAP